MLSFKSFTNCSYRFCNFHRSRKAMNKILTDSSAEMYLPLDRGSKKSAAKWIFFVWKFLRLGMMSLIALWSFCSREPLMFSSKLELSWANVFMQTDRLILSPSTILMASDIGFSKFIRQLVLSQKFSDKISFLTLSQVGVFFILP